MIEIIPAIDLIDGKCVRLSQGDYSQKKIYSDDPVKIASAFEAAGIRRLHMVDLDGAKLGSPKNLNILELVARKTNLVVDYGGGIKTDEDLAAVFSAGAQQVTVGSLAVKEPQKFLEWLEDYGNERIILASDSRSGKISVSGWQESTELDTASFIKKYCDLGVRNVLCTDIDKDGMLSGVGIKLYEQIITNNPECYLIASGGLSSFAEIHSLDELGIPAVILGKAFYEGRITLKDLEQYCAN